MPSPTEVKALGISDQVAQCVMAGTDLSKHQMKTLLTAEQKDGSTHTAQVCTCCGASITTVTDKHGLELTPAAPFTWARAMHDTLDRWNRR